MTFILRSRTTGSRTNRHSRGWELRYWTQDLARNEGRVAQAVAAVGVGVDDIKRHLAVHCKPTRQARG
jgi:hypothetical protein